MNSSPKKFTPRGLAFLQSTPSKSHPLACARSHPHTKPVPDLIRDLPLNQEAPDPVRGGMYTT